MVRAITVCVDYSDILDMTLPHNKPFIDDMIVVTSKADTKTLAICEKHDVKCHVTDAFYRKGAVFNKFWAIEEAFDVFGRDGWLLLIDADIAIPQDMPTFVPTEGYIYTPHRRIKEDITDGIPEQRKWAQYKRVRINEEFSGYFQLFHGRDRVLGRPPWHTINWTLGSGSDTVFFDRWPVQKRVRPPFEVLHLGPPFTNWAGRASKYADGTVDKKAQQREEARDAFLRSQRSVGPLGRFLGEKR